MHRLAILSRISDYFERRRRRNAYWQTAKVVSELPFHIRKDIGWPAAFDGARRDLILGALLMCRRLGDWFPAMPTVETTKSGGTRPVPPLCIPARLRRA